jgi:hypothetical protein
VLVDLVRRWEILELWVFATLLAELQQPSMKESDVELRPELVQFFVGHNLAFVRSADDGHVGCSLGGSWLLGRIGA